MLNRIKIMIDIYDKNGKIITTEKFEIKFFIDFKFFKNIIKKINSNNIRILTEGEDFLLIRIGNYLEVYIY